jgi:hypothetical protein
MPNDTHRTFPHPPGSRPGNQEPRTIAWSEFSCDSFGSAVNAHRQTLENFYSAVQNFSKLYVVAAHNDFCSRTAFSECNPLGGDAGLLYDAKTLAVFRINGSLARSASFLAHDLSRKPARSRIKSGTGFFEIAP